MKGWIIEMKERKQTDFFGFIKKYYVPNNRLRIKVRRAGVRKFLRQDNRPRREWEEKMDNAIKEKNGVMA